MTPKRICWLFRQYFRSSGEQGVNQPIHTFHWDFGDDDNQNNRQNGNWTNINARLGATQIGKSTEIYCLQLRRDLTFGRVVKKRNTPFNQLFFVNMETIYLLFNEANIFPTLAMLAIIGYWMLMIVGVVGMETLDFDLDLDSGVDIDLDPGLDIGGDLDADVATEVEVDVDTGGSVLDAGGADIDLDSGGGSSNVGNSPLRPLFEFLYMSDVPIVIVGTALMFGFWISNVTLNLLFNPTGSFAVSLIWFIPNCIVALLVARVVAIPAAAIGRKTAPEDRSRSEMIGINGTVTTSEVTERFGQMEVKPENEPEITLNIRVASGHRLTKGDVVKIISYNHEDGTFLVEQTK